MIPKRDILSVSGLSHVLLAGLGETGLPEPRTGREAFRMVTDEHLARATFGKSPFVRTRNGLRYRLAGNLHDGGDNVGEAHRDQCLSTFASLQLSLDEPITLESEQLHLRDLLSESIANFTFDQRELSWAAETYVQYLPPRRSWTDRFGRTTTFSELVRQLMKRGYEKQSCAGLHVLRAVVLIVRADDRHGILDARARADADTFVKTAVASLTRNQRGDGSWDYGWHDSANGWDARPASVELKLVATGHMLEILHELRPAPPRQVLVRSAAWLLDTLRSPDFGKNRISICPLAHGIRAVRLAFANPDLADSLAELVRDDRTSRSSRGDRR